ncbi:hypothetical protein [Dactylosporangium sp. NPDC050588]|uniref:hypothetical protein n=1 Tax=Dactylosporangium sp. NPDC050588 TaxID=3157211 RepID=UPI0033C00182
MSTPTALAAFAEHLGGCRRLAGEPSLREIERLTRQAGRPYPRATIDDKLQGRTVPDWGFVEAFVAACDRNAGGRPGTRTGAACGPGRCGLLRCRPARPAGSCSRLSPTRWICCGGG